MTVGRSLDLAVWNLSWPLAALAACGPAVSVDSAEGPSSSPTDPSGSEGATEPTGGECFEAMDCGYGYACVDGRCVYQCYCGCGIAPPRDDHRFRCAEAGGYECYADIDCGEGSICQAGYCVPDELPCTDIPVFDDDAVVVEFADGTGAVSALQFGEVDPSRGVELFGIVGTGVFRASSGVAQVVLDRDVPLVDLQIADIGSSSAALVIADGDVAPTISAWALVDDGFAQLGPSRELAGLQLATADVDADERPDVLVRTADGVWLLTSGDDELALPQSWRAGVYDRMGVADIDNDAPADLVVDAAGELGIVLSPTGTQSSLGTPGSTFAAVGVHGGDFGGDGIDELVVVAQDGVITSFVGPVLETAPYTSVLGTNVVASAIGDVDGDARKDLVVASDSGSLTIRFGASTTLEGGEPFGCETSIGPTWVATSIAIGDYDADGDADIAITDGVGLRVLTQ